MKKEELIGAWLLRSWQMTAEDGSVHFPFGKTMEGTIIYSKNGYMSANIWATSRKAKISEGISEESILSGTGSYLGYSGKYTLIDEGRVIHHILVSSVPRWIGGDQERFFKIEGNKLIINSKTKSKSGRICKHELIWERPS